MDAAKPKPTWHAANQLSPEVKRRVMYHLWKNLILVLLTYAAFGLLLAYVFTDSSVFDFSAFSTVGPLPLILGLILPALVVIYSVLISIALPIQRIISISKNHFIWRIATTKIEHPLTRHHGNSRITTDSPYITKSLDTIIPRANVSIYQFDSHCISIIRKQPDLFDIKR